MFSLRRSNLIANFEGKKKYERTFVTIKRTEIKYQALKRVTFVNAGEITSFYFVWRFYRPYAS